jgi:hypothetical protein
MSILSGLKQNTENKMSYVIYNIETTRYLTSKTFKNEGGAKSFMTRTAKKADRRVECNEIYNRLDRADVRFSDLMDALIAEGMTKREAYNASRTGDEFNRADYAIAEYADFKNNIEKTRMTRNLLNPNSEEFAIPMNTPNSCDPGTETYHCM